MSRAYVALVLAALSWGLALTSADAALADLSATDLLFLETASGTAVVLLACLVTRRRIGGAWRPAVVLGSLEPGIAYVFANVGLILTSAAVGSMLFALESVFVVAIAAVLLRVRPRRVEVSALVLGVLGTVLVASAQSGGRSSGMGVAIMVVSTLISAGYVLATRRFAGGHEPVALVARQGVASLVVTAPFILGASLNGGSRLLEAPAGALVLACVTGVIGFAIPYTLWTMSLPHVRPGFAAVALNLVPLIGVASATLLGQGGLTPGQWAGGALILGGLVLMTMAEMAPVAAGAAGSTAEPGSAQGTPAPVPAPRPAPDPVAPAGAVPAPRPAADGLAPAGALRPATIPARRPRTPPPGPSPLPATPRTPPARPRPLPAGAGPLPAGSGPLPAGSGPLPAGAWPLPARPRPLPANAVVAVPPATRPSLRPGTAARPVPAQRPAWRHCPEPPAGSPEPPVGSPEPPASSPGPPAGSEPDRRFEEDRMFQHDRMFGDLVDGLRRQRATAGEASEGATGRLRAPRSPSRC